ncbi:hypothetical protein H9Q73_001939 [Fusarium xylarioides]|nr:hypothetical protein H9Q73_001939 [Fusarium xylarioides]
MDSSSGSRTRVVVALDFGTTSEVLLLEIRQRILTKTPTRIEFSKTPIEWFKLNLLHRDDLPSDVRNSRKFEELTEAREAINVTAVNATARYLGKIWKVFCEKLQYNIPDTEIQVSVTVPVLWPLYARQAMEEALYRAGILNENVVLAPKFLIEPEAAALAFFSNAHYFETNISKLKPGDTVMICDCGGGTVKIYLPIKWAASRQRRMPIGQGDDVTFTQFSADLASIFDPVVGKITHLIEKEMLAISAKLSEDVSYLVVAGGFGQNTYLRQKVAETVARVSPTTNILDYPNGDGWNAVSMGAVTKALQAQAIQQQVLVTSRIVRADWGVRAGHGNSIIRLVKENESLDATRPNRRNVPAEALSAEYHTGRAGFSIRVCRADQRKNESQVYRNVCRINWKTVDVGLKPDMNADLKAPLEIDFIWDGAEMEFSLFYDGVQQSSVEIEHYWNV